MQLTREELLQAARAHHKVRGEQGFTTSPWSQLEAKNQQQYLDAMRAAVAVIQAPDLARLLAATKAEVAKPCKTERRCSNCEETKPLSILHLL